MLPHPRRRGRYRHYFADDVGRLVFVRRARELGFTLDEVRELLRLAARGGDACAEVRDLASVHLADVRKKIADLWSMEKVLAHAVRQCDAGKQASCPLIHALSEGVAQ